MAKLLESRFITGADDKLAVEDVYEVTENAIRSRALAIIDKNLSELLGELRVPFEQAEEVISEIEDIVNDVMNQLQQQVNDLVGSLPKDMKSLLSGVFPEAAQMGFASLELLWDYVGEIIYIDTKNVQSLKAVKASLDKTHKDIKDGVKKTGEIVDQAAEAIVYGSLVKEMIKGDIVEPIEEVIDQLSTDKVKQLVAEHALPTAINPSERPGPSFKAIDHTQPNTVMNNAAQIDFEDTVYETAPQFPEPFSKGESPWSMKSTLEHFKEGLGALTDFRERVNDEIDAKKRAVEDLFDWSVPPKEPYTHVMGEVNEGLSSVTTVPPIALGKPPLIREPMGQPRLETHIDQENLDPIDLPTHGIRERSDWVSRPPVEEKRGFNFKVIEVLCQYTSPEQITRQYPAICNCILYHYQLPKKEINVEVEYTQLTQLLNTLKKGWDKTLFNHTEVSYLGALKECSRDSQFVLTHHKDSEYKVEAAISSSYQYNSISELLKVQYPLAAL